MAERPDLDKILLGLHSTAEGVKLIAYVESLELAAGEREAELSIHRACANGKALEALALLIEVFGGGNAENPWLGVMANVALLKIDAEKSATLARELDAARSLVAQLTELLNLPAGWCNHGILMDQSYHPRCSNCVLMQARAALAAQPRAEGEEA